VCVCVLCVCVCVVLCCVCCVVCVYLSPQLPPLTSCCVVGRFRGDSEVCGGFAGWRSFSLTLALGCNQRIENEVLGLYTPITGRVGFQMGDYEEVGTLGRDP